jgi:hypothetical protein
MKEKLNQNGNQGAPAVEPVEGYIGKAELGRRLCASPRTIDEWMRGGLLPYYKFKRSVRFKWSEVERKLGATCRVGGQN